MQPISISMQPYLAFTNGRNPLAGIVTKPEQAIMRQQGSKPVDSFLSALITAIELGFIEGSKYLADYLAGTGELDVTRRLFAKALNSLSNPVYIESVRQYPGFPLSNGDIAHFLEQQDECGNTRVYLSVQNSIIPRDGYFILPTTASSIRHVHKIMVEMVQDNPNIYGEELVNSTGGRDEQFGLATNSDGLLDPINSSYKKMTVISSSTRKSHLPV